jgi:hypothetical protein
MKTDNVLSLIDNVLLDPKYHDILTLVKVSSRGDCHMKSMRLNILLLSH